MLDLDRRRPMISKHTVSCSKVTTAGEAVEYASRVLYDTLDGD